MEEATLRSVPSVSDAHSLPAADTLEEIARRLVAIHYPLAEHLDGGPELQRQTRKRIEELMAYVDAAIDASH